MSQVIRRSELQVGEIFKDTKMYTQKIDKTLEVSEDVLKKLSHFKKSTKNLDKMMSDT